MGRVRAGRRAGAHMSSQDEAIAADLMSLASALCTSDTKDAAGAADVAAAHAQAQASLVAKVGALPPQAAFSSAALQAFKRQHVAMTAYIESVTPSPQPQPPAPS